MDAQIRSDLETLARHRAVTDAILIAGDEDMVPAVEAAQAYGVRIHLWGVEPPYGTNQAERLIWESDTVDVLDAEFLKPFFATPPAPEPPRRPAGPPTPSPAAVFGAGRAPRRRKPHAPHPGPVAKLGPAGRASRRSASTSRRSGSSPGAATTSATCCPARSCPRSSTRSC